MSSSCKHARPVMETLRTLKHAWQCCGAVSDIKNVRLWNNDLSSSDPELASRVQFPVLQIRRKMHYECGRKTFDNRMSFRWIKYLPEVISQFFWSVRIDFRLHILWRSRATLREVRLGTKLYMQGPGKLQVLRNAFRLIYNELERFLPRAMALIWNTHPLDRTFSGRVTSGRLKGFNQSFFDKIKLTRHIHLQSRTNSSFLFSNGVLFARFN